MGDDLAPLELQGEDLVERLVRPALRSMVISSSITTVFVNPMAHGLADPPSAS